MTRRGWLRLMAAGVLVVWLCLFLHLKKLNINF